MYFHRLVLNPAGVLLFPAGFDWTTQSKATITSYVKLCVTILIDADASLSEEQIAFANI